MIAKDLVNNDVKPLKPADSGSQALKYMYDLHVSHLPLVENGKLSALISDHDIHSCDNQDLPVGQLKAETIPFIYEHQHLFDILKLISENHLTLVPVLDAQNNYIGTIDRDLLIECLTKSYSANEPGGIIMLNVNENDYMLSEIARLVEDNDAKILSIFIESDLHTSELLITLKINKINLESIIRTFNRFNYNVVDSFCETTNNEDLRSRYDEFMKYLNI